MHINTGFGSYGAEVREAGRGMDRLASLKRSASGHKQVTAETLTDIICSGVPERYPRLKIIVAEVEVGWIPFWLTEMDKRSRRQSLPLKPSEYFYRQCYSTFTEDEVGGPLVGVVRREQLHVVHRLPACGNGQHLAVLGRSD